MKNLLIIVLLLGVGYGIYSYTNNADANSTSNRISSPNKKSSSNSQSNSIDSSGGETLNAKNNGFDNPYEDIKPAPQLYKTVNEALDAVLVGAKDYDDLVLEQFVDIGNKCSWCSEFFSDITERMLSKDSSDDERSYFAEVLAISGSVDNIAVLTDAIKNSTNEDDTDLYAEALELSMGKDDVVNYLEEYIKSDNELLAESSVAAITNHGSRKAIDVLYKHTVESGDEDGFYSLGIGLGEIIPDKDSLPYLVELANKKDKFSHLAVKAILNSGEPGLKTVLDMVSRSKAGELPEGFLEDAIDHVAYEDTTEGLLKEKLKNTTNDTEKEFIEDILEDMALEDEDDEDLSYDDDDEN